MLLDVMYDKLSHSKPSRLTGTASSGSRTSRSSAAVAAVLLSLIVPDAEAVAKGEASDILRREHKKKMATRLPRIGPAAVHRIL